MRKFDVLKNVAISAFAAEGKSIAKVDGFVLFVDNAVSGDVVDLKVNRLKKSFGEAKAIHFHSYSELRETPRCEHFGVCGGCKWQHLSYGNQLEFKQQQVIDALEKIGKVEFPAPYPILGSEAIYEYRNRLDYTFSSNRWLTDAEINDTETKYDRTALGFHIPGRFDKIVHVNHCHLQGSDSNEIRLFAADFARKHDAQFYDLRLQVGLLRQLIVRTSSLGEIMVIVWFNHADDFNELFLNALKDKFPQITSLCYAVDNKRNDSLNDVEVNVFSGNAFIREQMEDLQFKIGPKSFYQTNSQQAFQLYKITREFAGLTGTENVYDLYTGTGTIALFVAKQAKKVVGIEYVEAAIEDAKKNAIENNIANTSFYAGDMKNVLNDEFVLQNGKPDVIITDPPRVGMHEDVVRKIIELAPQKVVYVSCNPATQARDLAWMNDTYKVSKVQAVDMFPHTHHIENVVLLERR